MPSAIPTESPTFLPTSSEKLQITITYTIRTIGFNAEDINKGTDNNISESLLKGTRILLLDIIEKNNISTRRSLEAVDYHRKKSNIVSSSKYSISSEKSQLNRRLVMYSASAPPFHSLIAQTECDASVDNHNCVIIKTVITVFIDEDENADRVRDDVFDGFNQALSDGSFLDLLN